MSSYPQVNGNIYAVISDGSGGWIIGGSFTEVGGIQRSCLARINADGSLAPFNPGVNGDVYALARVGSTLYVGGKFTQIGGQARSSLAAVNINTGGVTSFNVEVAGGSAEVFALSAYVTIDPLGSTLYVGGNFTQVGGQSRKNLAAVSVLGGVLSFNPSPDYPVNAIAVSGDGNTIYVGGYFTNIGGAARTYVAALNTSGTAKAFKPNPDANVYDIFVSADGNVIYMCGEFHSIGGQSRNCIAACDPQGNVTSFNPVVDNIVSAITLSGNTLFMGGIFRHVGGEERLRLAAVNATTGSVLNFRLHASDVVCSLAVSGSTLYAGGSFRSLGGEPRKSLAAVDTRTGKATSFNPGVDGAVYVLARSGSNLYVGGDFLHVGGQARKRLAAINTANGQVTPFNPGGVGADYDVECMACGESVLYVGGGFTHIGGQARDYLAAVDMATGQVTSFNPGASDEVRSLALSGTTLYVGGSFTQIGGQPRNRLAAIDTTTGQVTPFNPGGTGANGSVLSIVPHGSLLYLGGVFTQIAGVGRNRLAAVNTGTGQVTSFHPEGTGADDIVRTLALYENLLYVGGDFDHVGGEARSCLAAVDVDNGQVTAFNPDPEGWVYALGFYGATLYVGGSFGQIGGELRRGFAEFPGTYDVKAKVAAGQGSVSPASQQVNHWEDATIEVTPAAGYRISSIVDNGRSMPVSDPSGMDYVIPEVHDDHDVVVGFRKKIAPPPSSIWYLAEGCTAQGMQTYVLVQNPGTETAHVKLTFQTGTGEVQGPEVDLPGGRRTTFLANAFVPNNTDVSTKVTSTKPVVCERAMYGPGMSWAHDSIGVTVPENGWYLAEGCTAQGMQTYVLVQNPGTETAHVKLTFQTGSGQVPGPEVDLPGGRRTTFLANAFVPNNTDVSTKVTSTKPVVCERAMYGPGMSWAHVSIGCAP
ncbi:hypothetical protein [Candidatus Solincola tengchongensis]|uniref:hypothetical protein n=1 Tax=Candidatus Solincola tengchongensis TaxID=2900693 RepID=UPI00257F46A8